MSAPSRRLRASTVWLLRVGLGGIWFVPGAMPVAAMLLSWWTGL